jgi:2-polyprenyl-3-methyl-5-hydroxy-6-metoxy-1,4-benzoquinol methylase
MQIETKKFYDQLKFPGSYTQQDIDCHLDEIKNPYIWLIDSVLCNNISVLDIGCGTGYISNFFAQKYSESNFTAIDFSDAIDIGCDFSASNNQRNITWIKQDFLQSNLDTQFDVVICQGVFHHIRDQNLALKKIKQLVRPGGIIVFGVYHPWGKIPKKFFKLNYHSEILKIDQEHNVYETSFTCREVVEMFGDRYKLISSYPCVLPVFSHLRALLNYQNGGLITYIWKLC